MLDEVLAALAPRPDGFYVDATFGRGGHARAILARLGEKGALLAMDRDPEAVAAAREALGGDPRVTIVHAPFSRLGEAWTPAAARPTASCSTSACPRPSSTIPARGLQLPARRAPRHAHGSRLGPRARPSGSRVPASASSPA
jgi:hypothetical protein